MKQIAIIDDSTGITRSFAMILEPNYVVETYNCMHDFFHTQAEKLKHGERLPDLILCDKNLKYNRKIGGEYVRAMAQDPALKDIPKIIITSDYIRPCCPDCDPNIRKHVKACYNKVDITTSEDLENMVRKYVR